MDFFSHMLESLAGIADAIGLIFALVFLVCLVALFILIGLSMQRLKKYGCKSGFAKKIRTGIEKSPILYKNLHEGQVTDPHFKESLLSKVFYHQEQNRLFYYLMDRFLSRPEQTLEGLPSLQSLSDEFAMISNIQRTTTGIKCISSLLPAVGLCGTLMGMFRAFTGTDFNNPDMQNVMSMLMHDFGTALWTTILAVIFKVWADVWCHFGPQRKVSIMTNELIQLKYYLLDIIARPAKMALPAQGKP